MKKNKMKKYCLIIFAYILVSAVFYLIGGEQLKSTVAKMSEIESKGVIPEFTKGQTWDQVFISNMDELENIQLMVATLARKNTGHIVLTIEDGATHAPLAEQRLEVGSLTDNSIYTWTLDNSIKVTKGQELHLKAESYCEQGQGISFYYGDMDGKNLLIHNGEKFAGQLYLVVNGKNYSLFGTHYWLWVILVGALFLVYMIWSDYQETKGKITKGKLITIIWKKYKFLIQQLVARDFKTKYKRSVLGYLWSFLNPLLTMLVQYIVFSTIFKSGIENYPVYLLSGIILFNFFSEAVGQGLGSIINNASLITKVYVPKYIYPITKVASTSINLFISLIPLLLVMLMTGVRITPALLLLPFVLACLLLFCTGMVLMLCAAMVFFRDTQYLWGIASMIWMYATPLFYPENIIPSHFRFIQTFNPMYHMVKFARIILIEGISPAPILYGTCLLSAMVTCVIGAWIFKKTQNKFVLYI
jgi:ABC-2 type transport system permease protein